ncbi:hypothetical protein [Nocardia crassostreae]|uniref:hypothetical protein n=1 Tax=Nocardia crassostreae TaxID=53428 RepID=UPI00082AB12E|nr:hypothetical protein [Nocardia crassostreae]
MKNWRELDHSTRKALLRGEPAADPEIDRIAREYAERGLKSNSWRRWLGIVVVSVAVGALIGYVGIRVEGSLPVLLPAFVLLILGRTVARARHRLALIRMLNVSDGEPQHAVLPGAAESLEIRITTVGVLRLTAPLLSLPAVVLGMGWAFGQPVLIGAGALLSAPIVAYACYLLSWSVPGHPQILDNDGIHTPRMGLRVGWDAVREIRVVPLRATASDSRKVIAFILFDDEVYLRQLPKWQAVLAKMNKRTYLSSLVLMDSLVDKPIDEIAAAAAALSGLPAAAVA